MPDEKLVITVADDLAAGLAVNAGALLGLSLGRLFPHVVGPDVIDGSGVTHPGISTRNLPILAAAPGRLRELAEKARATPGVTAIDLTRTAQRSRTYDEYTRRLAALPVDDHELVALALHGPSAAVTSLTGDLALFR